MSLRERYPAARIPRTHYFVSLSRGERQRTFSFRPWTLWTSALTLAAVVTWAGWATYYISFRDQMLAAYETQQAQMQADYESRLADAREALDKANSQQSLDRDSIDGKLHELLSRQVALEQRGDIVVAMAKQATVQASLAAPDLHAHPIKAGNALTALGAVTAGVALPASARAYAPMDSTVEITPAPNGKPRPLDEPQKHSSLEPRYAPDAKIAASLAIADSPDLTPSARIGLIALSLDRTERKQLSALQIIDADARRFNERWSEIIDHTGLSFEDVTGSLPKGEGGPFIPLIKQGDTSEFSKSLDRISHDVAQMERLKRVLPFLPLREPLFGDVRETSPFGYRADPFLGRAALHPGIDLVQSYGAEIHATAAGKVVHAGWMGGYGNMVEIDHGNGIATRYGHMSETLVAEGDTVKIGDVLGRIGSTGRSTGPHLHYEVRIDGEPVDPERYLEVAAIVTPATQGVEMSASITP